MYEPDIISDSKAPVVSLIFIEQTLSSQFFPFRSELYQYFYNLLGSIRLLHLVSLWFYFLAILFIPFFICSASCLCNFIYHRSTHFTFDWVHHFAVYAIYLHSPGKINLRLDPLLPLSHQFILCSIQAKEKESWEATCQALKLKLEVAESNCIHSEVEVARLRSTNLESILLSS